MLIDIDRNSHEVLHLQYSNHASDMQYAMC